MKIDPQIRQQIDVCRPGSADLALCDLQQLATTVEHDGQIAAELDRSQKFDWQIREALGEVAVPVGLNERLLAAVAATKTESSVLPDRATVETTSRTRFSRLSRRTWLYGAAAIAATVLLALSATWLWPRGQLVFEQQEIANSVQKWQAAAESGKAITALPRGFRLPGIVVQPGTMRQFMTDKGWSAVSVKYGTATLLIVKSPARFNVPTSPYARLSYSTQPIATWQSGDLLYVLVVPQGDGQQIEHFLRPGSIT